MFGFQVIVRIVGHVEQAVSHGRDSGYVKGCKIPLKWRLGGLLLGMEMIRLGLDYRTGGIWCKHYGKS
jgi:hypothetical protein